MSQGLPDESRKGYFKEFEALNESFNVMVDKIDDRDKRLSDLAYNDVLTGLRNRAYLDEMLNNWNDLPDQKYTVVYLDLDNFSHVNDTYGHHVGDQLLIKFSFALSSTVDHYTDIIHLGGDEFILIIKENNDLNAQTTDIMTKIMSISNEPIVCEDRTIYFTLSAGISYCPKDGQDFWTLLRNADTAMYSAKADGKNTYRYFTREMKLSLEHKLSLEQYLRPAMKKDEFKLEFQPQYSLDGKMIRGFEALARWDSEVLGMISPIDFIAIAEENKMIIPLGQWILRNACETVKLLNKQFNEDFIMAVNVSPVELKEFDYVNKVIRLVQETGIKPQWLEIEITENVSIDAFTRLSATLEKLHEFGISISIDDFGTGYSSLAYLQKIPLDVLKVDRTFITHLGDSKDHNLMTETIFLMAKKLGLKTIAEGVETQQHVTFLKGMDCDFIQGYLMSKSLNLQDLIALITKTYKPQENEEA